MTHTDTLPVDAPKVAVPVDTALADEPALTIGDIFKDKAMMKTLVSGVATIIAGITGRVIGDDTVAAIVDVIAVTGVFLTMFIAQLEARERAVAQAEQTRAAVYAPSTVADIAEQSAHAGHVEVVPDV